MRRTSWETSLCLAVLPAGLCFVLFCFVCSFFWPLLARLVMWPPWKYLLRLGVLPACSEALVITPTLGTLKWGPPCQNHVGWEGRVSVLQCDTGETDPWTPRNVKWCGGNRNQPKTQRRFQNVPRGLHVFEQDKWVKYDIALYLIDSPPIR